MKTYNFLAINPYKYKIKGETDKPLVVELPDNINNLLARGKQN